MGSGTFNSGTTIQIKLNKEMQGVMEILQSLEYSGVLIKVVTQAVKWDKRTTRLF